MDRAPLTHSKRVNIEDRVDDGSHKAGVDSKDGKDAHAKDERRKSRFDAIEERRRRVEAEGAADALRAELRAAREALARAQSAQASAQMIAPALADDVADLRVGILEEQLEQVAEAYARLHLSSVLKSTHRQLEDRYAETVGEASRARARAARAEARADELEGQVQRLRWARDVERNERRMLVEIVEELRTQDTSSPAVWGRDAVGPLDEANVAPLVDVALAHVHLVSVHLASQLEHATASADAASAGWTCAAAELAAARAELAQLRTAHARLAAEHAVLDAQHAPCAQLADDLRRDALAAERAAANAAVETREARDEVGRAEAGARADRDALRRANEAEARWRTAETALEDEMQALRDALRDAYAYEQRYRDLQAEHAGALEREAAAREEVARLGEINAELVGAGTGAGEGHRLNYIESVRREAAEVKMELAGTRQLLNAAHHHIAVLEHEIGAYKSIDAPLIPELAARTRVVRRAPEGARLVASTRSVSGPVRR
ncbi:hypothetical protein Q5752_000295 [Cryptotrichosporon argae]